METEKYLCDMKLSETGKVVSVNNEASLYRRFLDIGLIPGTEIECVLKSPSGDPSAFLIRGAVIAIRAADSGNVIIKKGAY